MKKRLVGNSWNARVLLPALKRPLLFLLLGLLPLAAKTDVNFFNSTLDATGAAKHMNSELYLLLCIAIFSSIFFFWYKKWLLPALASIVLSVALFQNLIENDLKREHAISVELDVVQTLSTVKAKLEGNLQKNLSMLTGFAAYISAAPDLSNEEFSNYAKEVFKKEPLLVNFAAAKDLVVNYVYPYEGNERVIGLDYRENKEQRQMALQVAQTGNLMVVGPVNLVQGGTAFIGRAPIFTGENENRRFWGIISAPLKEAPLYQASGLYDVPENIDIAIRSFDAFGELGKVFHGNADIFEAKNRKQYTIIVGGGTWQIAAIANAAAYPLPTNIMMVRLIFIALAILACSFILFRYRQNQHSLKLEKSLRDYQRLLENVGNVAQIGGWKLDQNEQFRQWTKQTSKTLKQAENYRPTTVASIEPLMLPSDYVIFKKAIEKAFTQQSPIDVELQLNNETHPDTWVRVIAKISEEMGEPIQLTGTFQDITNRVQSAKIIEHQATYDALTDLPNRILFNDRLALAIEDAQRNKTKLGVLFIDLDRFKPVNDNYGHLVGDKLLIETASRIKDSIRHSDTVSRLSGDEFGVIINDVSENENVIQITETILEALRQPYLLDSIVIHCSASAGISVYPEDGDSAQSLLRKADQAMYQVKSLGRNDWQFYTREMQIKSEYRHHLLNDLIEALKTNTLIPYYQPIFDLNNDKIVKCEALTRWQRADGEFVSPLEFITLAEESGLINTIDLNTLNLAATALIEQQKNNHKVELSINVSPRLFQTKDKALNQWLTCIEKFAKDLPISVEITERLLTEDSAKALKILTQLKQFGVKIAIDDFGTGYSSLSYLIKFPVDIIKIDRAFIDTIGTDTTSNALIETILLMAKRLQIKVVAEGIETEAQLLFLKKFDCDFGQGYYLGRPMPGSEFESLINRKLK